MAVCQLAAGIPPASAASPPDSPRFADVSGAAGLDYVGKSWGSAWADYDGDGDPDLWLVNHQNAPSLYRNNGDGTFTDVAPLLLDPSFLAPYDTHGAAWADFDNDGDPDLYALADEGSGGPVASWFFRNDGTAMAETGAALGLDYPLGRGRMPLWLDYDRDGYLDVLHTTTRRGDGSDLPTALFHRTPDGFVDVAAAAGFVENTTNSPNFGLLGDLTGDGRVDLVTHLNRFPENVYDTGSLPFTDHKTAIGLPTTCCVIDAVVADLDNDLDNDLYMVRGEEDQDIVRVDAFTVEAHLQGSSALPPFFTETGLRLETAGDVTIHPYPFWNTASVYIGAGGTNPVAFPFTVSAADTSAHGIFPHVAGVDTGLYIGWDASTSAWEILRTNKVANLVITGSAPIDTVEAVNWNEADPPRTDVMLRNHGGAWADETAASGIPVPGSARGVVAADLDNDMDLDLYLVSTGPVANRANRLYENLGGGIFAPVAGAGGAAGATLGRGESASVADYDGDGFLDLAVTNGVSKAPFDQDGPTYLFRNLGNANHWIQIDLRGGLSNRDGVGARLFATAGGITQLREQNGGVHYRGQNHQRVHFGLAANTDVDTLRIVWPSGTEQVLFDVPADQVLSVQEPGATDAPAVPGRPAAGVPLQIRAGPNPVDGIATVSFSLPRRSAVSVTVHDVSGRVVRRLLHDAVREAGAGRVRWSTKDTSGRPVPSGVYFLRLETPDGVRTAKLSVIRKSRSSRR